MTIQLPGIAPAPAPAAAPSPRAPTVDPLASRLWDATGLTVEALVALGVERSVAVVVAPAVLGAVATETHWRGVGACERVAADLTRRARGAR